MNPGNGDARSVTSIDSFGGVSARAACYSQVKELDSYLCQTFGSNGNGSRSGSLVVGGRRSRRNSRDRAEQARRCNVTVAVRVRPLSTRDMENGARNVIVSMQGNSTVVVDPTAFMAASQLESKGLEPEHINLAVWARRFEYDHCYWSCSRDGHYADQPTVFADLGMSMLEWAWQGFNCSLFAYGQTGSGKSYSMMGTGAVLDKKIPADQHGLIPRICGELFEQIKRQYREEQVRAEETTNPGQQPASQYKVEISYMEIYNEAAYDLLGERSRLRKPLRVREHPRTGTYVDGLSVLTAEGYDEIERLLEYGGASRTHASTSMNSQSSRSHSVFTINFRQTTADPAAQTVKERLSRMHLVDLAGSERVYNTGASGMRLREANAINKSLAALADVINGLSTEGAGGAMGGGSGAANGAAGARRVSSSSGASYVPYRNSTLTWLLKESLGGNAKTCMLATISPADAHYDETVSTLKYAERVKKVTNFVVVNESCSELRHSLEAEVMQLRRQLEQMQQQEREGDGLLAWPRGPLLAGCSGDGVSSPISSLNSGMSGFRPSTFAPGKIALVGDEIDTSSPRLVNLNQDPLFSETVTYYIQEGVTMLGSDPQACDVHLSGVDIRPHHCCITNSGGHVTIYPFAEDCETYVNGHLISTPERSLAKRPGLPETVIQPTQLTHKGRLILGRHHFFRFEQGMYEEEREAYLSPTASNGHRTGEEDEEVVVEEEEEERGAERHIDWDFAHRELLESQSRAAARFVPVTLAGEERGEGVAATPSHGGKTNAFMANGISRAAAMVHAGSRASPAFSEGSWRSEHKNARMKLRAKLADNMRNDGGDCASLPGETWCKERRRPKSALDQPALFNSQRAELLVPREEGEGDEGRGGGDWQRVVKPSTRRARARGRSDEQHCDGRSRDLASPPPPPPPPPPRSPRPLLTRRDSAGADDEESRYREPAGSPPAAVVDNKKWLGPPKSLRPPAAEEDMAAMESKSSRRREGRGGNGEEEEEEEEEEAREVEEENSTLSSSAPPPELNEDAPAEGGMFMLESELYSALKRAERAETERAEISRLLVAREKDIEELKKRLEHRKSALLHQHHRGSRRDLSTTNGR